MGRRPKPKSDDFFARTPSVIEVIAILCLKPLNNCSTVWEHYPETLPAHQHRLSRDRRARLEPSSAADRSMLMNSPSTTAQTAIGVVGEDVVGSLQHAPLMDTIRAPTSTSLLNFRTTRSASQPPGRMPK